MIESTHYKIEKAIKKKGRGKIIFANDFTSLGTSYAVRHALSRLCKSGLILRLAEGIYLYPKIDKELGLGVLYPSIDTIAKSIAKKDKARIAPTGLYALNRLGFSTQVPANAIYLTDGSPRRIKIGNGQGILFKHTVPKNLAFKSDLAMLIVFALKEIKKDNVTQEHLDKLRSLLKQVPKEEFLQDVKLMPEWIKDLIIKLYE
ncbi:type IV toxin-antitoxin system AbiEi family antitoxin domain-containing protein [Bacteroidales bacterium OttesenSCG-928-B11]|nr:type IV toxin-antitoxin system AbiEi family antitoxin domain-containing protein [Bacteroidales bacterium OttesenSCG-928-C03]MDL2312024.1 type IV toxin-antitoxin system AbiEi family antitoxin domain-containing protein [Bacteroidales bacterium OttesenSCG-928-B11]